MVDLLLVNARGTRFRLPYSTVDSIPFSRLAVIKQTLINWKSSQDGDEKQAHLTRLKSLCDSFDPETNEFYFNANPNIVKILLKFYVGKKDDQKARTSLGNLCPFHIEDELVKYWGIKEFDELLDQGCMVSFDRKRHSIQEKIDERYAIIEEVTHKEDFGTRCFPRQREIIWNIMESPASSIYAKVGVHILLSITRKFFLINFRSMLRFLSPFRSWQYLISFYGLCPSFSRRRSATIKPLRLSTTHSTLSRFLLFHFSLSSSSFSSWSRRIS